MWFELLLTVTTSDLVLVSVQPSAPIGRFLFFYSLRPSQELLKRTTELQYMILGYIINTAYPAVATWQNKFHWL